MRLLAVKDHTREIAAKQTRYGGVWFRSRLEARWAVFFDFMGWDWEYEKRSFKAADGLYLPDFYLPKVSLRGTDGGVYVEIKPSEKHLNELPLLYLGDNPLNENLDLCCFWGLPVENSGIQVTPYGDQDMMFMVCESCGFAKIEYGYEGNYRWCDKCSHWGFVDHTDKELFGAACNTAKTVEF